MSIFDINISIRTVWLMILALSGLTMGCSTGIEGTKTIKMSRDERRDAAPSPEEELAARLVSQPIEQWSIGKRFLVADNKAALLLKLPASMAGSADGDEMAGRVLEYAGFSVVATPGGKETVAIRLKDADGLYTYDTGMLPEKMKSFSGLDLPMMIDLDLVAAADSLFRGRKVWTLSRLWYDDKLEYVKGSKFVPVTISGVRPGTMLFPLLVDFIDDSGRSSSMLMNVAEGDGSGTESRTFPVLFTLSDPKVRYPAITPENWELICAGSLAVGMTKDECRLALGNPSNVDGGSNWNSVVEVWGYRDGTFLKFRDGLLAEFRKMN